MAAVYEIAPQTKGTPHRAQYLGAALALSSDVFVENEC